MSSPDPAASLLTSQADVLGERVLGAGGDPSFEACAALLPPLVAYTFLAGEGSSDVVYAEPDGRLGVLAEPYGTVRLDPVLFDPREILSAGEPTAARRGLVDGWLPAIDYAFTSEANGQDWREVAFVAATGEELYASLRAGEGGVACRIGASGQTPIATREFDARLGELRDHWRRAFADAMEVDVPEPRVTDACRASLVRAFISHNGPKPHYGVGLYRNPKDDAFPPATLSTVNACAEWNLLARARAHLDYYLDHLLRPDGTFDYYGPAVSEYGQMLDAIARTARRSGDAGWLRGRVPEVERIVGHLLALRRDGQGKWPKDDARHGLLLGSPEADTRKEVDYYYSADAWTWRGWTEIGRVLLEMGDEAMKRRGEELLAEAASLRADTEASLAKCVIATTEPPFVPPVAGFDKPFATMTQDTFASYTNYRYWAEMLSAGFLRPEWHDAIIEYRRQRGGELLGTTRFLDRLDDWPYAGYAHGLLLRDRVRHYLLGFYGHLAAHCMGDTFTSYEQVAVRGAPTRTCVADYCVPAQLVAPLMARWMLVFEEPDADVLWLCRAAPRRWLEPGKRIAVRRAPTRWGLVSFAVEAGADGSVAAAIELPRADFPAEIRLRLRRPDAQPFRTVTLNGQPHADFDPQGEFVRIVRPKARSLDVLAAFPRS